MEVEEDNKLNSFLVIDLKKTKGHSVKFYYRNTEDTFKNLKIIRCFNTFVDPFYSLISVKQMK
jgi:hypothetical protein